MGSEVHNSCSDTMSDSTRRSESTTRERKEDMTSIDSEKKEDFNGIIEEEKAIGLDDIENNKTKGQQLPAGEHPERLRQTKSLRSIQSHRSYAAGDGYTCFSEPDEQPNISGSGAVEADPFLVTWDGDSDPMNPRSMTKLRRWTIVLIVAASSLCV